MNDFLPDIENCLDVLKQGGIILYPTDTVWGLGCDATNESAVEKIFLLKQRPAHKSMIILLADEKDILKYVSQPDPLIFDYLKKLQTPATIIYPNVIGIAGNITGNNGEAGIRIVQEPFCKHLIKRFRKPLVSSSANISGEPTPLSFKDIRAAIREGAGYVVRYRRNDTSEGKPSSVLKWNKDGTVTIIRP